MLCLTVCQPWASAIMAKPRIKVVENRDWSTPHRGVLAIHAGKSTKWIKALRAEMAAGACGERALAALEPLEPFEELPLGMLLGVVELVDCKPYSAEFEDDPFACGPFCWVLENPNRLATPVPYRGQQGLFEITFKYNSP